ncbi:MAG: mycofactocin biosynthesis chaperone MftB [Ilumatobacteraceae bacterium]
MTDLLERPLELDPQVALRPEPFGALAYHYGNRRLVFLKHPDMVAVARELATHESLAATLAACAVDERRWPSFASAFESLIESNVVRERVSA